MKKSKLLLIILLLALLAAGAVIAVSGGPKEAAAVLAQILGGDGEDEADRKEKNEDAGQEAADEADGSDAAKDGETAADGSEKTGETGGNDETDEDTAAVGPGSTEQEPAAEPVTITLSFAGDCTLGKDRNTGLAGTLPEAVKKYGDYSVFLSGVQEAFAKDDLTVVNLEGPLTTSDTIGVDKKFVFKGDPDYVNILTKGSVEAADTANNHSRDYGVQGLSDTKQVVSAAGITVFGEKDPAIREVRGIKVGLVGVYELPYLKDCEGTMISDMENLKAQGADLLIVCFHWGIEGQHRPDGNQTYLARSAIDHGADLVIGHHPHVLQGIETYKGRQIVYSLGNFCFGGNKNPSDKDSMIYQQTFTFQPAVTGGKVPSISASTSSPTDGKAKNISDYTSYKIIPCRLSSTTARNDYRPTILTGAEGQAVLDRIASYSEGLSQ